MTDAATLDARFMRRCFALARLGAGSVAPNPEVGAVVVHNGLILGEGWHRRYGEAHAEVNAVASVKADARHLLAEATIYVSLEPCHHHGKTPPCVDLVLRTGFRRVVIGCRDPNPLTAGKSIDRLRAAGVDVTVGVLEREAQALIAPFATRLALHRPYVVLKWAQSSDGFLGRQAEQLWLTNDLSKRLVHSWRAQIGAIMVGTNTVLTDNPALTPRYGYDHRRSNPLVRVVTDFTARIPPTATVFDDAAPTLVFVAPHDVRPNSAQTHFVRLPSALATTPEAVLPFILRTLAAHTLDGVPLIDSVLVEGGAALLQSFIAANLWDEARIFTAPVSLRYGIEAPTLPRHTATLLSKKSIAGDELQIFHNERAANSAY